MITAGPEHAAALAAIHQAAFPAAQAWGGRDFEAQLGFPGVVGLIHPDGGLVVVRIAADEAEILTLGVIPLARGQGVGRALLGTAMALAAAGGARTMFLEAGEDNAPALSLYRKAGFRERGRRRGYYPGRVDALVLSADLSQSGVAHPLANATAREIVANHKSFYRA